MKFKEHLHEQSNTSDFDIIYKSKAALSDALYRVARTLTNAPKTMFVSEKEIANAKTLLNTQINNLLQLDKDVEKARKLMIKISKATS